MLKEDGSRPSVKEWNTGATIKHAYPLLLHSILYSELSTILNPVAVPSRLNGVRR